MPEWMWQLILVIAVLLAGSISLIWGLARLRRYLEGLSGRPSGSGWTLEEIKRLYKSGQLTDKQYERLKGQIVKGPQHKEDARHFGR